MAAHEEDSEALVSVFVGEGEDAGRIALALKRCPLCELDGEIVPGISLSPDEADQIAEHLHDFAAYVRHFLKQQP